MKPDDTLQSMTIKFHAWADLRDLASELGGQGCHTPHSDNQIESYWPMHIASPIAVLAGRQYALTSARVIASGDLSVAVKMEFNDSASVAEFTRLHRASQEERIEFVKQLGLQGGALIQKNGSTRRHMSGAYFICYHSQGRTCFKIMKDRKSHQPWTNPQENGCRLDLCTYDARWLRLPVLVDLGAAPTLTGQKVITGHVEAQKTASFVAQGHAEGKAYHTLRL